MAKRNNIFICIKRKKWFPRLERTCHELCIFDNTRALTHAPPPGKKLCLTALKWGFQKNTQIRTRRAGVFATGARLSIETRLFSYLWVCDSRVRGRHRADWKENKNEHGDHRRESSRRHSPLCERARTCPIVKIGLDNQKGHVFLPKLVCITEGWQMARATATARRNDDTCVTGMALFCGTVEADVTSLDNSRLLQILCFFFFRDSVSLTRARRRWSKASARDSKTREAARQEAFNSSNIQWRKRQSSNEKNEKVGGNRQPSNTRAS